MSAGHQRMACIFFCFKKQGLKIDSCGKYRVQANSKRNYRLAAAY